jgi:hypothetical protein
LELRLELGIGTRFEDKSRDMYVPRLRETGFDVWSFSKKSVGWVSKKSAG